jgi:fibronectin-binding autotransporter adhesin
VAVNGDLTLQNGYSLTTSGPLTVDGALKVTGNSTVSIGDQLTVNGSLGVRDHSKFSSAGLDVGVNGSIHVGEASVLDASGGRFLAIDGTGTLLRGNYEIDGLLVKSGIDQSEFSSIKYNGAADGSHLGIQTIGAGVNLTLNGRGAGNAFQDIGAANTDSLSQLHQIDGTVVAENSFKKTFSNDNSSGFTPFNQVNNGSLTIQGKISFPTYPLETTWSVNGQFTNNGLLTVGAGGNFNDFDLSDANYRPSFTSAGTVQVQSGGKAQFGQWIDLSGGVLGGSGVYDIQDKGEVRYRGASSSDLISEIGGTVNLTLHGNYALVDQFNPGPNDPTADALQSLAKIDNGASLTLTDNADLSTSQSLENDGSLTLSAGGHLEAPNVTNTNYLAISPGSQLTTSTFTQSGNGANTEVDGTLFANVDLVGGLLHGDGLIFGDVTQTGGIMHAGNSPGTLNVAGNYSQGVGSFLEVDFNSSDPFGTPGTDWSLLTVAGNATLDGTVTVNLLRSLTFHLGDLFEIMTYGSLSSNPLLNVQFLELGGGMHFAPVFGANELDLQVVADAANTPEPGTLVLLAAGLAGFVTMARRRGDKK